MIRGDAMRVLRDLITPDDIVVLGIGGVNVDWLAQGQRELDFSIYAAMGLAGAFGLGLALAGNHPVSVSLAGFAWNLAWVSAGNAVGGAIFVSSMSSIAPRVTPTDLPARSAAVLTFVALAANTAWKNGEYAEVKSITFSRSGFLPSVEITRSAFFVCR